MSDGMSKSIDRGFEARSDPCSLLAVVDDTKLPAEN